MNYRKYLVFLSLACAARAQASVICSSTDGFEDTSFQFVQTGNSGVLTFAYAVAGTDTVLEGRVTLGLLWTSGDIHFFEGSNALDQHARLQILFYPAGAQANLELQLPVDGQTLSHAAELPCIVSSN